ncbi:MAG: hypothetical protein WC632_03630 [Candidatus Margulisiibacteriota bacterium]
MKRWPAIFFLCSLLFLPAAAEYASLGLFDATDWAAYYDDIAGYLYEEPGCVTLSPHDNYLLYKTLPDGTNLKIKRSKVGEMLIDIKLDKVPALASLFKTEEDVSRYAAAFKATLPELAVYPMLGKGVLLQNGAPVAQFPVEAGPAEEYVMPQPVSRGEPVRWEKELVVPVAAGQYKLSGRTEYYPSAAAPVASLVPFGAWLVVRPEGWKYEYYGRWFGVPEPVVADLLASPDKRRFRYLDENRDASGQLVAARFAGQPFGRESLVFDGAGGRLLLCAAGETLFERALFIKDIVQLLTVPGPDDLDSCVDWDPNISFYRQLALFRRSKGKNVPASLPAEVVSYYKLYNNIALSTGEQTALDPCVRKAFKEMREERLPRDPVNRRQAVGLYQLVRQTALVVEKQAGWYNQVRRSWKELAGLRAALRQDFDAMGVLSQENRQNLVEGWLETRLNLARTAPPDEAKYVGELSFSSFFKPAEKLNRFNAREQAIMLEKVKTAVKGETVGLNLNIVPALNDYNFGVLLNEILGNLYRSHGCLHASPRNILFLYELLPLKTKMNIKPYSERVSAEAGLPFLTDLVNYREDLDALKVKLADPRQVAITVYPATGLWVINLNGVPLAKLSVLGGPKEKMYLVEERDKRGRPVFQDSLMYPTTPGTYYFFRKTKNYLSNLYRSTTTIPQGGALSNREGEWSYQTVKGDWRPVPSDLQLDLELSGDKQNYTYYDQVSDASGEVVSAKWGSQPFGTYAIQTTRDGRSAWPELIHSSGDLMMEERSLVNDLLLVLTAPYDSLTDCVTASPGFSLYEDCAAFVADPARTGLIGTDEAAAYKLYYGLPLSPAETVTLPPDSVAAIKLSRNEKLSAEDEQALISAGVATRVKGKLSFNRQKILGLQFEIYQFVVTIEKYAHHYETLQRRWGELSGLRRALLQDFNEFVLKDPELFRGFMRELMLRRNNLEKLSQSEAVKVLSGLLADQGVK